jgi:hypothetical protein
MSEVSALFNRQLVDARTIKDAWKRIKVLEQQNTDLISAYKQVRKENRRLLYLLEEG